MENKIAPTFLFLGMFFAVLSISFSSITFVVAALVLTTFGWFGITEGIFVIAFTALILQSIALLNKIMSVDGISPFDVVLLILALVISFVVLPLLHQRWGNP